MSNDGWSSKPVYTHDHTPIVNVGVAIEQINLIADAKQEILNITGIKNLKTQGSNLIDENQNLYFQCCKCEALFDPHTKSFKSLHERAAKADWKFRWNKNGDGYSVYCVKCGEGVE